MKKMRIYSANSVFIGVTRRCNMCCAHCLRGDAKNIDIQEKYINELYFIGYGKDELEVCHDEFKNYL